MYDYKLSQLQTMTGKLTTDYLRTVCMVAEVASGKSHVQTGLCSRDSAHNLLSPCMCPSSVHTCVAILVSLTDSGKSQSLLLFMVCLP